METLGIVIGIVMLVLNLIGIIWLGIAIGHWFWTLVAYGVILGITFNIKKGYPGIIVLGIGALITLVVIIVCIVKAVNEIKSGKQQKELNNTLLNSVKEGNKQNVQELIEKGGNVNYIGYVSSDEKSLLEIAVENNDKEMVSLLIEKGANVNLENGGITPLDCTENEEMIALLKSHGAKTQEDIEKVDSEFISSVRHLDKEKIKSLISQVSDIDIDVSDGGESGSLKNVTALMFAVQNEEFELVRLFVENGADIDARDSNDATALFWAVFKSNVDIIDYLISKGAYVNETFSRDGDEDLDLLMLAASLGNIEVVDTLLKNGANVLHKSKKGANAIAYAHSKGFTQVEALLEKAYRACFNV